MLLERLASLSVMGGQIENSPETPRTLYSTKVSRGLKEASIGPHYARTTVSRMADVNVCTAFLSKFKQFHRTETIYCRTPTVKPSCPGQRPQSV